MAEDEMDSNTDSMDVNLGKLQEIVEDRGVGSSIWGHKVLDFAKEQQQPC